MTTCQVPGDIVEVEFIWKRLRTSLFVKMPILMWVGVKKFCIGLVCFFVLLCFLLIVFNYGVIPFWGAQGSSVPASKWIFYQYNNLEKGVSIVCEGFNVLCQGFQSEMYVTVSSPEVKPYLHCIIKADVYIQKDVDFFHLKKLTPIQMDLWGKSLCYFGWCSFILVDFIPSVHLSSTRCRCDWNLTR